MKLFTRCFWRKAFAGALLFAAFLPIVVLGFFAGTHRELHWNWSSGGAEGAFSIQIVKDGCLEYYVIVYPRDRVLWVKGVGLYRFQSRLGW